MGRRKSVPENLMYTILNENSDAADEGQVLPEPDETPNAGAFSWEERPERVGIAFNLSKQLGAELERLRRELWSEEDARPSRSELVEEALRIAVEDVGEKGEESDLFRRLAERRGARIPDAGETTTQRSVDESGWIFETTLDGNGDIIDEDVVGAVSDLPVVDEYEDKEGWLVSVAEDDLGNTYEQVLDESFDVLETRLLRTRDGDDR